MPIPNSLYFANKGKGKGKGQGAPPGEPFPSAKSAPRSLGSSGDSWALRPRPGSIFQHVVMRRRPFVVYNPGAVWVLSPCAGSPRISCTGRKERGMWHKILQANQDNPCFVDLEGVYPEPQGDQPPLSPATGDYRPIFHLSGFFPESSLGAALPSRGGATATRAHRPSLHQ